MKKNNTTAKTIESITSCLCRYDRRKIPFAFLFGSYAEGRQTPLSDIDIAIFFGNMSESEKTKIEHHISLLFDEQVNILRLDDENISPLVKMESLGGHTLVINDEDFLNRFTLSIIHRAEETKRLLYRLRKVA